MLFVFLVFCVEVVVLFNINLCFVQNVGYVSGLSILDWFYGFLWRLYEYVMYANIIFSDKYAIELFTLIEILGLVIIIA
jgi:hypothetical protein